MNETLDFEIVTYENKPSRANQLVQIGDLIFAKMKATQKTLLITEDLADIIVSTGYFVLQPRKDVLSNKYLFYYLNSKFFLLQKDRFCHGATQKALTKDDLIKIKIVLPPLEKQQKIAFILEKCESAFQKRKNSNRLTDEFLKSTFLEMFGDPVRNSKNWKIKKLKEVCTKIQDGTHYSPRQQDKGYPYITARNIRPWGIDLSKVTYISEEKHKQIYKRCDPEKGDVIYIKDGVTAGLAKVNTLNFEFSMLSSLALIRPDRRHLNPLYLEYYLNHPNVYKRIMERKSGTAITRLILKEINDIEVHVPPTEIQQKFANLVQKVEKLKQKQKESEKELTNLFNSLMQRAFRGEL